MTGSSMRSAGMQATGDFVDLRRVVVVVPKVDCEEALLALLDELSGVREVIVVDDGSIERLANLARSRGATVLQEIRKGYGAACRCALSELRQRSVLGTDSPRVVVFLDGGQFNHAAAIGELVEPILLGQAELVLGSRWLKDEQRRNPGGRNPWGNRLACMILRLGAGRWFTDAAAVRAIDYAALRSLGMRDEGAAWPLEMQIKAVRQQMRVLEIPLSEANAGRQRVGIVSVLRALVRYGLIRER